MLNLDRLKTDTTEGKPRVLILGEYLDPDLQKALFPDCAGCKTDHWITYGFGSNPYRFDHWVPANQYNSYFKRNVFLYEPEIHGKDYPFDMVILDLNNWPGQLKDSFCHDSYTLLGWSMQHLVSGGTVLIVGADVLFPGITGSLSYRLENIYGQRVKGCIYITGIKKESVSPDRREKDRIQAFLRGDYAYLPQGPEFRVHRHREEEPIMLSNEFDPHHIARAMIKNDMPGPFETIRHLFEGKDGNRTVRIPLRPPIGQIAKLATLAKGTCVDDQGYVYAIRGISETVTIKNKKEKTERDMKRLSMVAIQLEGDDPGHLIRTHIG